MTANPAKEPDSGKVESPISEEIVERVTRDRSGPVTCDQSSDDWNRALDSVQAYDREIEGTEDPRRRASLCCEVGRLYETRLGDDRNALSYYQRAYKADSAHIPAIRASRHIFARFAKWSMVLYLFDAEIRATRRDERRVALLLEKADVHLARFKDVDAARACYSAGLAIDADNRAASHGLCVIAALSDDVAFRSKTLENAAESCADPQHRACLLVDAASVRLGQDRDDQQAVDDLREALTASPGHFEAGAMLSRILAQSHEWEELVEVGEALAEHAPDAEARADQLIRLARTALDQLGDEQRARRYLALAVDGPRAPSLALETLVDLLARAGLWHEAASALKRLSLATADTVTRVRLLSRLADLQIHTLQDEDAAVETLQVLLSLDPTWLPALRSLGALLARRGEWRPLVAMHEAELPFVEDTRQRANKLFKIGEILENRLHELQPAAAAYRSAIELTPGFLHAVKALGRVLAELGDWEEYVGLLKAEAGWAQDQEAQAYCFERMAECFATRLNQPMQAIEAWQRVLSLQPDHLEAIRNLGRLYAREGLWRELVEINEAEIRLSRDDATILTLLVRSAEICERDLEDVDRAHAYLRRALDLNPRYLPALQALGRIYQERAAWTELIAMYEREIEISHSAKDVVNLYFRIGGIWNEQLNNREAAIRAYEEAVRLAGDHLPSVRALQRLYTERGDVARLAELLEMEAEFLTDPKEQAALLCRLGELYERKLDRPDRALEVAQRAVAIAPDYRPALVDLARLYEAADDPERQVAVSRRLAEVAPTRNAAVEAWLRVGRLCAERMGREPEAIQAYESVLTIQPDHLGALLALERLFVCSHNVTELPFIYGRLSTIVTDTEAQADFLLARARLHEGLLNKPGAAVADYRAALEINPQSSEAMERLELLAKAAGDREALANVLGRQLEAVEDPSERMTILLRRGDLLREAGQAAEATNRFEAVLELDAESLPAVRALRELYVEMDRAPEALYMAEREGRLTVDPVSASNLLLAAARIRENRVVDLEGALANYREALERDPTSDEAASGFRRLAERCGRWEELVEVLRLRADSLPDRNVELMQEISNIYARRLNRPDQAVRILNQVLGRAPTDTHIVLQQLADLYADQESWGEAAAVYERLREDTEDEGLRRAVTFRLAAIYEKKQPDPERARHCLDMILDKEPENVEALLRRAALAEAANDVNAARAHLRRAVVTISDPVRQGETQLRLARLEELADNPSAAVEAYQAALELIPDDTETVVRLGSLYATAGQAEDLFALFRKALDALPDERGSERNRLQQQLGELCLSTLNDPRRAASELEPLLEIDPSSTEARSLYASALARIDDEVDRAIDQYLWILDRDPFAVEPLKSLRALSDRAGQFDRAYQISVFLNCLHAAGAEEQDTILTWRERVVRWPSSPLDDAKREALRSRREAIGLDGILGTIVQALPELFASPPTVAASGLATGDLEQLAKRVGEMLGIQRARLETDLSLGEGVRYIDRVPESVVFGAGAVTRLGVGEQAFHLGRGLELGRRRLAVITRWTPHAVRSLLETVSHLDGRRSRGFLASSPEMEQRVASLKARLSRKARRQLSGQVAELRDLLASLDVEEAFAGFIETGNRVGMLACGGIVPALEVLRKSVPEWVGGGTDTATVIGRLRQVPGVAELARWLVSNERYRLREQLGLTPDEAG